MTRTLIVGTTYCDSDFKRALLQIWASLADKFSPDCDVLIVDSASPIKPIEHLPGYTQKIIKDEDWVPKLTVRRNILSFQTDVGRLDKGGKDGPGQALCKAINTAIYNEYDYVAHIETDLLFPRPVKPITDKLRKHGIKCAAPFDPMFSFMETQLMFLDVKWLRDKNYVSEYDWTKMQRTEYHEIWMERFAGGDLFALPLRGCRNDMDKITVNNFSLAYPFGCDYMTHTKDFQLYRMFLQSHGCRI